MSSQSTSNNETEFSRQAQALRGLAASAPVGQTTALGSVPESLDGGREADLGEIHQRLLPVLPHTLDSL